MALDYKTLQALAAAEPQEAAGHCPECGRAWGTSGAEAPRPPAPFPWRAVLLGVVGLAPALTFGLRAARAYRTESLARNCTAGLSGTHLRMLEATLRASCGPADLSPAFWAALRADGGRELSRDLLATAGGTAIAMVGVGAAARARLRARRRGHAASVVVALWGAGEGLVALACLQVLGLYLGLVALRLSLGFPLTW